MVKKREKRRLDGQRGRTEMSDDDNDEKSEQEPDAYRDFVDAYFRPGDRYREGTNPHGEVIDVDHADGPMRTRATLEPEGARFEMSGRPPRKEEGTKKVCVRLGLMVAVSGLAWEIAVGSGH